MNILTNIIREIRGQEQYSIKDIDLLMENVVNSSVEYRLEKYGDLFSIDFRLIYGTKSSIVFYICYNLDQVLFLFKDINRIEAELREVL